MTTDTVTQIKDRLSIVDVLSPYIKLNKAGKYYKGLCPFHSEKTPSFMVNPDRGFFHCFGCSKGGDMFTFIEEVEGVDFRGALKVLAEKAGVEISHEQSGNRDRKEKIYSILRDAEEFFVSKFSAHKDAHTYVVGRGITEGTITSWSIGYAPSAWRDALEYLVEKGHDESLIEAAGIVKRPDTSGEGTAEKKMYDRFRGRIMFPIRDVTGRTIGFSGRLFPETEQEQAKYLNSPETDVFDKSRVLYGLDKAKESIRKYDFAILVEGQFDLLMAQQTAYTNTTALSGTAFTEAHANLIKRYTENLVLAFDGDRAGVAASGRAAAIALSAGLNVKIASLPPGEDPADIIQKNQQIWKDSVKGAVHVVDFYISYLKNLGYDERRFKLEVTRVVIPYVTRITNAIDQAHFISRIADELHVPESAVTEEVKRYSHSNKGYISEKKSSKSNDTIPTTHYEPFLSRGETVERLLVGVMQSLDEENYPELRHSIHQKLQSLLGDDRIQTIMNSPEEQRVSIIEGDLFLADHEKEGNLKLVIDELLDDLEKELVRVQYRDTVIKLKNAEKEGDETLTESLLQEVSLLAGKLENR